MGGFFKAVSSVMEEVSRVPEILQKVSEEYNLLMLRFDQLVIHVGALTEQTKLMSEVLDEVVYALEEEGILVDGEYDEVDPDLEAVRKPDMSHLN